MPTAPPQLDALVETRIKRYRIQASVHGAVGDSRLQLSSKPDLPREDIIALLVFGKTQNRPSPDELQQLNEQDNTSEALNILFLGHAEVLAARLLGVDEINLTVSPEPTNGTTGSQAIESVEVGKYFFHDRLFGSYALEPPRALGSSSAHTLGAEVELNDSMSIGASVKARVGSPQVTQGIEPPPSTPSNTTRNTQGIQAEEAFIRVRWKF